MSNVTSFAGRFRDQIVLVTGAASGIGLGIAGRIAAESGTVIAADIDGAALKQGRAGIGDAPRVPQLEVADVTSEDEIRDLMRRIVARYGKLDAVVNSAGIVGPTSTEIVDYDLLDFRRVLEVNLVGSFVVTKTAIEAMLPNDYGRILLLASISGKEGNPGMAGYSTSKAGVIGLAKSIAKEFAQTGITINALAPALIATPLTLQIDATQRQDLARKIPAGRLGTIDEVAALACWIVSREASFNTGAIFDLSGGRATY